MIFFLAILQNACQNLLQEILIIQVPGKSNRLFLVQVVDVIEYEQSGIG
jgi:hypothetical protein